MKWNGCLAVEFCSYGSDQSNLVDCVSSRNSDVPGMGYLRSLVVFIVVYTSRVDLSWRGIVNLQ